MATVTILLFTSKQLKDDSHPVMLRVTKDRQRKYFSLGYSCTPEQWQEDDEIGGKFRKNVPNARLRNKALINIYWKAEEIVDELNLLNRDWTLSDFKQKFLGIKSADVFSYFDEKIKQMQEIGKVGNAVVYQDSRNALTNFYNLKNLQFSEVDFNFLTRFEHHLRKRQVKDTTISVYLRTLRALFNKAIREKKCKKDDYPFLEYKISALDHSTRKRALTKEEIKRILDFEPNPNKSEELAKHLFLFSYFTRGMNFVDIASLCWENIQHGRIHYVRAKTGKAFNIKISQPVVDILEYYRPLQQKNPYIFPILDKTHQTPAQIKQRTKSGLKTINKHLKTIAAACCIDIKLTSYVARHTFATVLKREGASITKISESLGHGDEKTTQIYLDSFENEDLDKLDELLL